MSSISCKFLPPVDIVTYLPESTTFFNNVHSVLEHEAILNSSIFRSIAFFTDASSKGVTMVLNPFSLTDFIISSHSFFF